VFLPREVRADGMRRLWADATLSRDLEDGIQAGSDKPIQLLEYVERDWNDLTDEVWRYGVIDRASEGRLVKRTFRGEGSCPLITPRYSIAAGEAWGRGPVLCALPDVKTLNILKQLVPGGVADDRQMRIGGGPGAVLRHCP
jgi:hypothetical protein